MVYKVSAIIVCHLVLIVLILPNNVYLVPIVYYYFPLYAFQLVLEKLGLIPLLRHANIVNHLVKCVVLMLLHALFVNFNII